MPYVCKICGNTQAGFSADCICASPVCRLRVQAMQPAEPITGTRVVSHGVGLRAWACALEKAWDLNEKDPSQSVIDSTRGFLRTVIDALKEPS
jgi:hypothetical protein